MLKLEQLAALVVAAGLAIVSYLLFFSWAGGGGIERRQRSEDQVSLTRPDSNQRPPRALISQRLLSSSSRLARCVRT